MDHFRRRGFPLVIDAVQLTHDNAGSLADFLEVSVIDEFMPDEPAPGTDNVMYGINVKTPDGTKRLSEGMYLVKLNEDLFVVPQGEFESKYQKTV